MTSIPDYYFFSSDISQVNISKNIKKIGRSAFAYCLNLKEVKIPDTVVELGQSCFIESSNITNLIIGSGVKRIDDLAFSGLSNLESINIPDSVTYIGHGAFIRCKRATNIQIGKGVRSIGSAVFSGCSNVEKIIMGENVEVIGHGAFESCTKLKSIDIGAKVRLITPKAFQWSDSLEEIKVDSSNNNYKSVNGDLYTKDGKKFIHYCQGKSTSEITIPEGVTVIAMGAFLDAKKLTRVILPSTIETFEEDAFWNCGTQLQIIYNGTKEEWKRIYNSKAFTYTGYVCQCTNGKITKKVK